jgi:hypothetical protein
VERRTTPLRTRTAPGGTPGTTASSLSVCFPAGMAASFVGPRVLALRQIGVDAAGARDRPLERAVQPRAWAAAVQTGRGHAGGQSSCPDEHRRRSRIIFPLISFSLRGGACSYRAQSCIVLIFIDLQYS